MENFNVVIGYDRNNRMPAYTLAESIMQKSSVVISFTFLHMDMIKEFTRTPSAFDSTEFSNSRFIVPYLFDYKGWALFLDNDMIVDGDIKELFEYADDAFDVMCVKHNQICDNTTKFLGKLQVPYEKKNWSSVMLFNNSKCDALTLEYVNTAPGLELHQFKWTSDERIGSLPLEWNYLVENTNQTNKTPKLIHYTNGGPYFEETFNCQYAEKWKEIYECVNDARSYK